MLIEVNDVSRMPVEKRWPGFVIPYSRNHTLATRESIYIRKSMELIETETNWQFIERTDEKDYLSFYYGGRCYSPKGKIGGKQMISVGEGCHFDDILREMLHATGGYIPDENFRYSYYCTIPP